MFSDLGLAEPILRAVTDTGYAAPTPIQAQVIPAMLDGQDVVGIAQTGTGKTAAFVLPVLHKLTADDTKIGHRRVKTLMLVPTRELATQIADGLKTYGQHINVKSAVIVGGVKPGPQLKALANGLDIVIATPGRLLDHLQTGAVRLDKTTTVILDEADQMLDLGVMPAIRKIMAKLPGRRQTAMLSATMPKQIRKLAEDFLTNPKEVSVAPAAKPIDKIEQSVCFVPSNAKRAVLVQLLADRDVERAIVFTRTKHGADRVVKHLDKTGLLAAAIHGNKSQNNRQRTLDAFRRGKMPILVATDVAARGIDIDDVSHVINYELPNVAESYVHRIGRTARAGRSGVAIALCDPSERKHLRSIEKLTKIKLAVRDMAIDEAMAAEAAAQELAATERTSRADTDTQETRDEARHQGRRGKSQRHKNTAKPDGRRRKPSHHKRRHAEGQDRSKSADTRSEYENTEHRHDQNREGQKAERKADRPRNRDAQRKNRKLYKKRRQNNQGQDGAGGKPPRNHDGRDREDVSLMQMLAS